MSGATRLFYSYASRDEGLRRRLEVHLSLLKREALLETWSFRQIGAGQEWKGVIDAHLNAADVVLLLVSADFIASDYCWDIEMTCALERHANDDAVVIPVILKPCEWSSAPFAKLQALPDGGKPVTEWRSRDKAWLSVAEGLRSVLKSRTSRTSPQSLSTSSPVNVQDGDVQIDGHNALIAESNVITHFFTSSGPSARDRVDAAPFFELISASFSARQLDFVVRNLGAPIVCQDFVAVTPGLQVRQWSPSALGTNQMFDAPTIVDAQYPGHYTFRMTFRDRWHDIRVFELRLDTTSFPAKLDFLEDYTGRGGAG